jgi:hypothetical protein
MKYDIVLGISLMLMSFVMWVYIMNNGNQDKDLNNQSQYSKDMNDYRKSQKHKAFPTSKRK